MKIIMLCGSNRCGKTSLLNIVHQLLLANNGIISFAYPEARVANCLLYYGLVNAVREIFGVKS